MSPLQNIVGSWEDGVLVVQMNAKVGSNVTGAKVAPTPVFIHKNAFIPGPRKNNCRVAKYEWATS
jgi:hypothetical protein